MVLGKELNDLKLLVLGMHHRPPAGSKVARLPISSEIGADLSEIEAYIDMQLPKMKHKREKYEKERVVMKSLVNNIERNRSKWRQGLFETGISNDRRIALGSVKEKLDEQSRILSSEEEDMKTRADKYRRQEEKLRLMREKLDLALSERNESRRSDLIRDLSIDY